MVLDKLTIYVFPNSLISLGDVNKVLSQFNVKDPVLFSDKYCMCAMSRKDQLSFYSDELDFAFNNFSVPEYAGLFFREDLTFEDHNISAIQVISHETGVKIKTKVYIEETDFHNPDNKVGVLFIVPNVKELSVQ